MNHSHFSIPLEDDHGRMLAPIDQFIHATLTACGRCHARPAVYAIGCHPHDADLLCFCQSCAKRHVFIAFDQHRDAIRGWVDAIHAQARRERRAYADVMSDGPAPPGFSLR